MTNGTPATAPSDRRVNYLNATDGVRSWLLTIDHKRIAILYLVGVTFFFALGASPPRSSAWSC